MADDRDAPPREGWHVPQRRPVLIALAVPLTLLALLVLAGSFYARRLRPQRTAPMHSFPAPGLETFIHGGAREPEVRTVPPPADPAVTRAAAAVVARGLPNWNPR